MALGAPTLLGAAFLVRWFTSGVVSAVALWVYLVVAVWLLWWLWRHERL